MSQNCSDRKTRGRGTLPTTPCVVCFGFDLAGGRSVLCLDEALECVCIFQWHDRAFVFGYKYKCCNVDLEHYIRGVGHGARTRMRPGSGPQLRLRVCAHRTLSLLGVSNRLGLVACLSYSHTIWRPLEALLASGGAQGLPSSQAVACERSDTEPAAEPSEEPPEIRIADQVPLYYTFSSSR